MDEIAIRVENLSKAYQISHAGGGGYRTLREDLLNFTKRPLNGLQANQRRETVWALKDISFEVKEGEVLGVIGRNGAGKSTLLKILSRITEPTSGYADIFGRVGSLLEVGTGFHGELTGRENVYLSGAILGMRRQEIDRRFDEIVAFAEVEQYIDTPVKRYSSGMYMRLAFAVAAHLEPEILLVDEVLAVGDAAFQKKCLGKMGDVARQGRTVLFVSHTMPAIQALCQKGMTLYQGQIQYFGAVDEAINRYMNGEDLQSGDVDLSENKTRFGSGEMRLLRFWLQDEAGQHVSSIPSGSSCSLVVEFESVDGSFRRDVSMSILINTIMGMPVSLLNTYMLNEDFAVTPPRGYIRLFLPRLPLTAGRYVLDLNLATHAGYTYADFIKSAAIIEVTDGDFYGTGRPGNPGVPVMIDGKWLLEDFDTENQGIGE